MLIMYIGIFVAISINCVFIKIQCGEGSNKYTEFETEDGEFHEMEKLNGRQYGSIDSKPITHSNEMAKDSQSSNPFVKTKKVVLIENKHIHRQSRKWNV